MHISLDSELGRQRRLNQIGETINSIATPAAAYSLRSLTGGDPKVVRVRRSSDNDEQDFTASEVASGAMLDYVNTQAIKPLDIKELTSGTSDDGRNGNFILANAAYSLRSLGTRQATVTSSGDTAGDTSGKYVVQVRRNVNGDQKSFTADEVSDGTLASFVNESFTSSLPLDVQGSAAAAYSLRSLGASQATITPSGDTGGDNDGKYVCQVRRDSDDALKSFTADEITDGTLLSFVNENINIYTSDYSAGNDGWSSTGSGIVAGNIDGIGERDDNLRFTSNAVNVGVNHYLRRNGVLEVGSKYNVTFEFYIPSSNNRLDQISSVGIGVLAGLVTDVSSLTELDKWVSVSVTSSIPTTATNLIIRWGDSEDSGDSVGDVAYIRNVSITNVASSGFVKTWYDQSGNNNHATQSNTTKQPKIVSTGALNSNGGLLFDGTDDQLGFTALDDANVAMFSVLRFNDVSATKQILGSSIGDGTFGISDEDNFEYSDSADTQDGALNTTITTSSDFLYSGLKSSSGNTISFFTNGITSEVKTVSGSVESDTIGGPTNHLSANLKEIIIYNTDQSEDRRAIEESISGHYGITLGAFNRNGFVRTWYDQSVTGQDATTGTPNGNHAVQTSVSKMPTIVSNGSLLTNGILFNTNINLPLSGTGLDLFKNVAHGNIFSIIKPEVTTTGTKRFFEASRGGGTTARFLFADADDSSTNASFRVGGRTTDAGSFGDVEGTTTHGNAVSLLTGFISYTGNTGTLFLNGTQINQDTSMAFAAGNTQDTSSDAIAIGGSNAANSSNFSCQEMIIYTTDQTNNRTAIEANIGSAHGINLPDGFDPTNDKVDGFVETWYDQSGNNNNAIQTTATSQPKIVNEGTYLDLVRTDGTDDFFDLTTQINFNSSHGVFAVYADANQNRYDLLSNATNNTGIGYAFVGSTSMTFGMISNGAQERFAFGTGTRANQNLLSLLWQPDSASAIYSLNGSGNSQNFTLSRYISDTAIPLTVIGKDDNATGQLDLKEIIIYATDQTSNRTKLEANIAAAHGITLS